MCQNVITFEKVIHLALSQVRFLLIILVIRYERATALRRELEFESLDLGPVLTVGLIKLAKINEDLEDALKLKFEKKI